MEITIHRNEKARDEIRNVREVAVLPEEGRVDVTSVGGVDRTDRYDLDGVKQITVFDPDVEG